jgi:hypothetical protein
MECADWSRWGIGDREDDDMHNHRGLQLPSDRTHEDAEAMAGVRGDAIALELQFWANLPPETEAEPVERNLQDLAARLARAFGGTYCSTAPHRSQR